MAIGRPVAGDRWWFKPVVQVGWGPGLHSEEPAPPELLSASWMEAAGWGPRADPQGRGPGPCVWGPMALSCPAPCPER